MVKIFHLRSVLLDNQFDAARLQHEQGHFGPAIVTAQAAVEVGMARAIHIALELRDVPEDLHAWIMESATGRSSSPTNESMLRLWNALGADDLANMASWADYKAGTKHRHRVVHRAGRVTEEQSKSFISDAEHVLAHVADVMSRMAPPFPDQRLPR